MRIDPSGMIDDVLESDATGMSGGGILVRLWAFFALAASAGLLIEDAVNSPPSSGSSAAPLISIAALIGGIMGGFVGGMCVEAARAVEKELRRRGEDFKIVIMIFQYPHIESLSHPNVFVGETGFHMGVEYKGKIYCPIHPSGLPRYDWQLDFVDFEGQRPVAILRIGSVDEALDQRAIIREVLLNIFPRLFW